MKGRFPGNLLWLICLLAIPGSSLAQGIPSGTGWYQIPNTRLRSVCPPNNFGGSGYDFTGQCWSVTAAWNSAVLDTRRNRLIVWGGGHADYLGNEIYALNLNSLTMQRLNDPALPPVTSGCSETQAGGAQPNARHTYDGIAYMENVDRMFVFGGSLSYCGYLGNATWTYDFGNSVWERKYPTGTIPSAVPGVVSAYDPNTGKVFLHDDAYLYSYDYNANQYQRLSGFNGIDYHMSATIDPVRRKLVIVGAGSVYLYDIGSSSTYTRQTLSTTGGSPIVSSIYPGLAYDPVSASVVAWNGGDTVYRLNIDTAVWTPQTFTGGPGAALSNGTYDRWSYSPTSGVFVVVNSVDSNAYTLRLSTSTPPPPTPDTTPPSVPTNLAASAASASQINLSWNASSDNVGVSGYRIYRSGVQIATPGTTSYQDTGLAANTSYSYTVAALDAAGNVSAQSGSVSATTQSNPSPPPPGTGQVTSFQLTSSTSGTLPFTIGLGFRKGDITGTPVLDIPDQQVIVKRRWNDNSVKHAIASGQVALSANTARTINVSNSTSAPSGSNLTSADIQAANPSASVQLGSIGTVNLSSLLSAPFRTWISGPEMAEVHYRSNVGSDPTLAVWFHVRLYKSGRLWVRVIVENGYVNVTTATKSYVPTVVVGGSTVYNNGGSALTQYAQTRWSAEGWIGGDPQITPRHDTTYLISTRLVPNYWKRNPSSTVLSSLIQTYTPMRNGSLEANMGAAGFQSSIGLLPQWDALYVTSGDARAYRSVLANSSSMNSYPIVWRDSNSRLVAKPSDFPTYAINGGTYGYSAGSYTWEMNHEPAEGYLAYLVTGDYWHYETLLMHTSLDYLARSASTGSGLNRILTAETRGAAWNMRNMVQLAAVFPAGDSIGVEYQTLLQNNINYWKGVRDTVVAAGRMIGYLYEYSVDLYAPGTIAPWQQHFWIQSMGLGSDIEPLGDMTNFSVVRDHMYLGAVGILGDSSGFCFNSASSYNVKISDGGNNNPVSWYPSWQNAYAATLGSLACGNTLGGSSGGAPGSASAGYWGNLLPAIAYAVDHGATGAQAAWTRLTGASNWSTVEQSGFDDTPNWGIVPRASGTPPPPPPPSTPPSPPSNLTVQ